jgi:hypothetical protein
VGGLSGVYILNRVKIIWMLLAGSTFLLAACNSSPSQPTATQIDPQAVYTAAAQTAEAMMTQMAATTPTQPPATPTETLVPATATLAPTVVVTPSATTTTGPVVVGGDNSDFAGETVPDGTTFQPGQTFQKSWTLKNVGTTTWRGTYALDFVSGDQMGAQSSVLLPGDVAPGQTAEIKVDMKAPSESGSYKGNWRLSNAQGTLFGITVWVDIKVSGASATPGPSSTPSGSETPGPSPTPTITATPQPNVVSGATISVDLANVENPCPYTFTFPVQFELSKAATVTYGLQADVGFNITLPDATTAQLDAGTHQLTYTLQFSTSFQNGWAQFNISSPENVVSNKVTFSLSCK